MLKRVIAASWSFIRRLDFSEVRKDIADDLKKGSYAMWALWALSYLHKAPAHLPAATLLKVVGIEAQALVVSPWVSWLLLALAVSLWTVSAVLRIKVRRRVSRRSESRRRGIISSGSPEIQGHDTRRHLCSDGSGSHPGAEPPETVRAQGTDTPTIG